MTTFEKKFFPSSLLLVCFLFLTTVIHAQTGSYTQTAANIYNVNSYTNVTFTNTPIYASSGSLTFGWIACHQPGFGNSTCNVELFTSTGFQNIATYSSGLDCSTISQTKSLSGSQLSDAAQAANGNIVFRFYISDGCQAGVGCASVNDPAVVGITLTYAYSVADFTVSDTTLCPGQSTTFTDITPGGVTSRSWSFPGGTPASASGISPTITYSSPGDYTVTLTTSGPGGTNSTTKTQLIHVYTAPTALINAGGPTTFCGGGNVYLNATTGAGYSYQWKKSGNNINGATSFTYKAIASGNYKVVVTSSEGCSSTSNTITVTENPNPVAIISANGPTAFCPGGSVSLQALTGGGFTYKWKKNGVTISLATGTSYSATATGSYTCKITNANGCSSTSNAIDVTVNTPVATVTLVGNATFCQGGSVLLKANKGAGLTYKWIRNGANISGATDSTYTATVSGVYKVRVTNNCGSATSTTKTVTVNSNPSASITASGPLTFCSGSTVTFNANTGTGLTYVWKKNGATISGATASSYVASTNGSYKVIVTNATNCTATSNTLTVTVNATIASISPGGPTSFCTGDSVVLTANSGANLTYQWLKNNSNINGATSINYTAKTAGTYKVIVTNSVTGCPAISSGVAVIVNCKVTDDLKAFNARVTPNPFTDDFLISFENFREEIVLCEIYSLTGQLLYRTDISEPKNEVRTGNTLADGVYLLKLKQGNDLLHLKIVKGRY